MDVKVKIPFDDIVQRCVGGMELERALYYTPEKIKEIIDFVNEHVFILNKKGMRNICVFLPAELEVMFSCLCYNGYFDVEFLETTMHASVVFNSIGDFVLVADGNEDGYIFNLFTVPKKVDLTAIAIQTPSDRFTQNKMRAAIVFVEGIIEKWCDNGFKKSDMVVLMPVYYKEVYFSLPESHRFLDSIFSNCVWFLSPYDKVIVFYHDALNRGYADYVVEKKF
ncbi:MAG: hypothetical protein R2800_09935 [Flavipsychrobacter sp.]